ncbi:hypothetical protein GGI43DRAFT_335618 [Trichoderma evansii]
MTTAYNFFSLSPYSGFFSLLHHEFLQILPSIVSVCLFFYSPITRALFDFDPVLALLSSNHLCAKPVPAVVWLGPASSSFLPRPLYLTIRRLCFFPRLVAPRLFLCLHHLTVCCHSTNSLPPLQRTALLVSPGVSRVPRPSFACCLPAEFDLRCHIAGSLDPGPRFFIPPPPPALPRPATLGHMPLLPFGDVASSAAPQPTGCSNLWAVGNLI